MIRARDGTWGSDSMRGGKQRFLKSAAEEFSQRRGITITLGSTLLIDDDEINVEFAQQGGSFALLFDPEDPTRYVCCIFSVASLVCVNRTCCHSQLFVILDC